MERNGVRRKNISKFYSPILLTAFQQPTTMAIKLKEEGVPES